MVHIITTLSHSYLACWAARFSIRYKTRKKNFKTIRIFRRSIAILGVGNLILKLAKYSFEYIKLRGRSHNASRDLGDFGPHPLHVTLFPILLSWIVKLSLTPAQRRGGDWQVSRKNLVMFLTNGSADAVGPRNSCWVPLPLICRRGDEGRPWCLQCRDWPMQGIYNENFGGISVERSNLPFYMKCKCYQHTLS